MISAKSTSDSTSLRGFATKVRSQPRSVDETRAAFDVREDACELDEQGERQEHADQGHPRVVEHAVEEARRSERCGDDGEQDDRTLLGEAVVHEAVRRVIASALVHRPAVEQPHDGDERRVQDRDGEDENRKEEGGDRRTGDLPARRQAERCEQEAEHLAAGVAHEDRGRLAVAQIEREETRAGECERERQCQDAVALVDLERVDGEEHGGDRGESRRKAVHVVEQVERVRHPDEPDECDDTREEVVRDQAGDREPVEDHEECCGDLGGELRNRAEREEVVEETRHEEDGAPSEDRHELAAGGRRADRDRDPEAGQDPGEDADAAEHRRRSLVPAILARRCPEPGRQRCVKQQPNGRGRGGQCSDRREHLHGAEA